jgi:hypothetical protein
MKGNKMSAILAILLMLSGALVIPQAFAVPPAADAVEANPLTINWEYPTHVPGETFTAYVDVVNVQGLFAFQVGFYFNPAVLQVVPGSVVEGGFLSNGGVDATLAFPGSIDNVAGVVKVYGWTLQDKLLSKTGSGHLMQVTMKIKNTLWPPYSGTFPGTPVVLMHFTQTNLDPAKLKLIYQDGVSEIPVTALHDGSFTLYVTPHGPTAYFVVSPVPPNYVGDPLNFDGSGSTPGWNGYASVPIVDWYWVFGDGNTEHDAAATTTHAFGLPGGYVISLVVTDADGRLSAPYERSINILVRPTGCVLDVYTQNWRYIDPYTYDQVLQGKGPYLPAEMFRPGDLVQLFVNTIYNGDPVAYQFVAYEVTDAQGNVVLTGNAMTNAAGLAEIDFRIPWPQTSDPWLPIFGTWNVVVTWEIGKNLGQPPYAWTQNDTMSFHVGWGVWSSDLTTDKASYLKGETVVVSYKIHNDYLIPINVLTTAVLYDDLMVPIGMNFAEHDFNPGVTDVSLSIVIPVWAFVGTGTVKANEYSTWPSAYGIAFGPEQVAVFGINHTFLPADP